MRTCSAIWPKATGNFYDVDTADKLPAVFAAEGQCLIHCGEENAGTIPPGQNVQGVEVFRSVAHSGDCRWMVGISDGGFKHGRVPGICDADEVWTDDQGGKGYGYQVCLRTGNR